MTTALVINIEKKTERNYRERVLGLARKTPCPLCESSLLPLGNVTFTSLFHR